MSAPTKGMVAGQPIQTGELTKEYEDGYARTFGEGTRERGRFVFNEETKQMERIDESWSDTPRRSQRIDISYMDGVRATDGTDISSMRKRREYMKQKGLADTSDFKEHWKKADAERAKAFSGQNDKKARRDAVGRAVYELEKKPRKPRRK